MKNSLNSPTQRTGIVATAAYKIAVTENELSIARQLVNLSKVELIAISGDALAIYVHLNGIPTLATSLPNNVIGFLAISDDSHAKLKSVARYWEVHGRRTPDCHQAKDQKSQKNLAAWIIDEIIETTKNTTLRNISLMRELTNLRIAHEETQSAFYALERYAESNFELARQQILVLEPTQNLVQLSPEHNLLRQLIPVVSVGVSDVSLHIAAPPTDTNGKLNVTLKLIESGKDVAKWVVPTTSLQSNWVRLSLQEAIGVDEQSLALSIAWTGAGTISLSAGPSHPDPKWCATIQDVPTTRTIALKVWRGLPGTRPTKAASTYNRFQMAAERWLVDDDQMRGVENTSAYPECVQYVEPLRALLVHPVDNNAILAKLSLAAPKGACQISASIESANSEAGPIDYAIAVGPPRGHKEVIRSINFDPGYVSGWVTLTGGTKSEIHLFLPESLETARDVYLATRVNKGNSNENCWAYFTKIRATS